MAKSFHGNQAAMLRRAGEVHGHATRAAGRGLHVLTRDHASVGYRVPKEWAGLPVELRGAGLLAAFKRGSRAGFLSEYGGFSCVDEGFGARQCGTC